MIELGPDYSAQKDSFEKGPDYSAQKESFEKFFQLPSSKLDFQSKNWCLTIQMNNDNDGTILNLLLLSSFSSYLLESSPFSTLNLVDIGLWS